MNVSELMSRNVLSVEEDTPVTRVVQLLVDHGISAVPVVREGDLVGLISESDLITLGRRSNMNRAEWFSLLIHGHGRRELPAIDGLVARDVMTAPVVSTSEHVDIAEAVQMMSTQRVKRLPVTRGAKLVGIISRADLLHGLARLPRDRTQIGGAPAPGLFNAVDDTFSKAAEAAPLAAAPKATKPATSISAADFRQSVEQAKAHADELRRAARREAEQHHLHDVEVAREAHINESNWRAMLLNARHAAERGETEIQILRFPREVCSDGGRTIDNAEHGWETTLHGEAAEMFHRWVVELKPRGFHLRARTIEYPNGYPGDIALFLSW